MTWRDSDSAAWIAPDGALDADYKLETPLPLRKQGSISLSK